MKKLTLFRNRKKSFEFFMVFCLFAASFVLARKGAALVAGTKSEASRFCIVIDAGHGDSDPGKIGVNGVLEKEINLSLAQKLKPMFENKKIQAVLTRDSDQTLADPKAIRQKIDDMQKRVQLITDSKAVLTISIHQNSYSDASVSGPQVFYYSQSPAGELLAKAVQNSLNTKLNPSSPREIKSNDNYYLLKKTPTPTVIVECGFLSNPKEAKLLSDNDYQNKVARAVFLGVMDYLTSQELLPDKNS